MTREEYEVEYNALEQRFNDEVKKLRIRYVKENQKFHIGDIIRDGSSESRVMVIEKTSISVNYDGLPVIWYKGHRILKNGNLSKRDPNIAICESTARLVNMTIKDKDIHIR